MRDLKRVRAGAGLVLGLMCGSHASEAAASPPLADRVPADAIVYFGWAGSEATVDGYAGSKLQTVLSRSQISTMLDTFAARLFDRVRSLDPNIANTIDAADKLFAPMWRHPSAFYFGGIDYTPKTPQPRIALLCDAGKEADALQSAENNLLTRSRSTTKPQGKKPQHDKLQREKLLKAQSLGVHRFGSMIVFTVGYTDAEAERLFSAPPAEALASDAAFNAALKQTTIGATPAYVGYVDLAKVVKAVDEGVDRMGDADAAKYWPKIRDALSLGDFGVAVSCAGFDQTDWESAGFITSSSGHGAPAFLNADPLPDALLAAAPATSSRVIAVHFDAGAAFRGVRSLVQQFDPDDAHKFDDAIAHFNVQAGIDVEKNLLDALGHQWLLYTDDRVGGIGWGGAVIVNRPADPQRIDSALTTVSQRANALSRQELQAFGLHLQFRDETVDGTTIHYLAIPFIAPSWAVRDGNLYLGLWPQLVAAAVAQVQTHGPSIRDNPVYTALQKRLGGAAATSIAFFDLPHLAPQSYTGLLAVSQVFLGASDVVGVDVPPLVVPPLAAIQPTLMPSVTTSWTDADGWHARSIEPFPAAQILLGGSNLDAASIGELSAMSDALMPLMNKARESSNRAKSAANERQIGQALMMYAVDHHGQYPPDVAALVQAGLVPIRNFVDPSSGTEVPHQMLTHPKSTRALEWVNRSADYRFTANDLDIKDLKNASLKQVLVERGDFHDGEGMNVLFADGHVEFLPQTAVPPPSTSPTTSEGSTTTPSDAP